MDTHNCKCGGTGDVLVTGSQVAVAVDVVAATELVLLVDLYMKSHVICSQVTVSAVSGGRCAVLSNTNRLMSGCSCKCCGSY